MMMDRALIEACGLMGDILQRFITLFQGLQVFPERMLHNVHLSGGLIMAEALMLELGKRLGRQRAHDIVYEAAQGAVTQGRPFHELLAEDRHITSHLTPQQITDLLDPAHYTGLCRPLAEQGAVRARQVAAGLASLHQRRS
jgi:3-carboxy-cis,cis-muconate cycloisomerase